MFFDEQKIKSRLTGTLGGELAVYPQLESSNLTARLLAKNGAPHGAVVIAEQQTAGRGRLGRSFFSPPGAGLYMSVILRPQLPPAQALLITPAVAVAAARAIEQTGGVSPRIKWVNDLYIGGKKLCGILCESALASDGSLAWVVAGIGINIADSSFPPQLRNIATSIQAAGGKADPNELAAAVLNHIDKVWLTLESRTFLAEYKSRSCVLGKTVRFERDGKIFEGTAQDIDDHARLLIHTTQGTVFTLESGEVSLQGDWT